MAELIQRSEVGVRAGSSAIWEISCLGLQSCFSTAADNQIEATTDLADAET